MFFFSVARWKNVVSQKVLTKFFLSSETQIDKKPLVAYFSLENQNEENAFGTAMAIFPQTNTIQYKHAG